MKELKKQFEKVKKLAYQNSKQSRKLDVMIYKKWRFSYSDKDIDEIIDTLDYGVGNATFERFVELMDNPNKQFVKSASNEGETK